MQSVIWNILRAKMHTQDASSQEFLCWMNGIFTAASQIWETQAFLIFSLGDDIQW